MKKSMLFCLFLFILLPALVFGSGEQEGTVETGEGTIDIDSIEPIEVKLTSITPTGHPIYSGLMLFKDLVESNTQGKIKVALFPDSQLGDQPTQLDMVRTGSVEIGHIGGGVVANLEKRWNIGGTMYLFRDYTHFLKVWGGPIGKEMSAMLEQYDLHVLNALGLVGVRHVLSKKPVGSIEDMKGLSIRVPEAIAYVEGFRALGANPTQIAFTEVYTALQLGTVDAMECPLDWIYKMRFHEVAKNLTLSGHISGDPYLYLVNKTWWEGLPSVAQRIIEEAAQMASLHANMEIKLAEAGFRKSMEEEGATFIEIDSAPFQKKISDSISKLSSVWGGDMELYNRIKNTK